MSCSNCFNGCTEIVSDQCVRYTGIDVPVLGIKTGDSLSYVEQALIEFLTSTLDGTGIKIEIPQNIICDLVKANLPTCGDLTVTALFEGLIKSACELQTQVTNNTTSITNINSQLAILNGAYDVKCITGVTSTSGTHSILQAVINTLCQLIIDIPNTYVALADLDELIAAYLSGGSAGTVKYADRMVPYAVVEYYGPISYFDGTGAGLPGSSWEKIYLCNGQNGTPDRRGVVAVGTNDGSMSSAGLNSIVNPSTPGVPTWTVGQPIQGQYNVVLTTQQLPTHNHAPITSTLNPASHTHTINYTVTTQGYIADTTGTRIYPVTSVGLGSQVSSPTSSQTINLDNGSPANVGNNESHVNYQPGIACYYIQYRP